jgi:hypothetical protein
VVHHLFPFTYNYLYKCCIKLGISSHFTERQNQARLHIARYLLAEQVTVKGGTEAVSAVLHHKSNKSATYYMKERVKRG